MEVQTIERVTKISEKIQNQRLRFLAKVDTITKLEITKKQKTTFHRLKQLYTDIDNNILTLSALILEIDNYFKELKDTQLNSLKLKNKLKKATKREKLMEKWALIKELRNDEKLSFNKIAEYLSKYHKLDVSDTTIFNLWNELEVKANKGETNAL